MVTWLLEAIAYALLGSAVVLVNRHREKTRVAGAALLALTVLSSASFFFLSEPAQFEYRVLREVLLITPVATVCAYMYFVCDGTRCYRAAILLCLIDVAFCSAILLYGSNSNEVRSIFGWTVNIVFIGLCVCIAAPGIRDAYRNWIADIERVRRMDSETPDFDYAIRQLDRFDRK